jgi:hypothetical protein
MIQIKKDDQCLTAFDSDNDYDILSNLKDNIKVLQSLHSPEDWDNEIAGAGIYINNEAFSQFPKLPKADEMADFLSLMDTYIEELEEYYTNIVYED